MNIYYIILSYHFILLKKGKDRMEQLYYPGFEVKNENWLKYALLYKEKVFTIIPYETRDWWLSEQYHYIKNQTNLLEKCYPTYEASYKTSREVIELLENMLQHPERYFSVTKTTGVVTLQEKWMQRKDFNLFKGKYISFISEALKEKGLVGPSEEGILMHRDIGLIYMVHLAKNIAYEENYDLTTDNMEYACMQHILKDLWDSGNSVEYERASELVINQYLPYDIENIPLEHIVRLRNREDYMKLLRAHNNTIKMFIDYLEEKETFHVEDYLSTLKIINKEMMELIVGILGAGATMATTVFIDNIDTDLARNINAIASACSFIGAFGGITTNKKEYEIGKRMKAKKFISNIKKLR